MQEDNANDANSRVVPTQDGGLGLLSDMNTDLLAEANGRVCADLQLHQEDRRNTTRRNRPRRSA